MSVRLPVSVPHRSIRSNFVKAHLNEVNLKKSFFQSCQLEVNVTSFIRFILPNLSEEDMQETLVIGSVVQLIKAIYSEPLL